MSYETSPACNVLVSENPEIAAAKSTVQGTNKATSNRAKTSTPSTSTLSSSASSASASSSSASSSAASSSSTSLSANNNQSSGSSSAAATSPGGNKNNFNKRYRRSINDAVKSIAVAEKEQRAPCTKNGDTNECANSKNFVASTTMRSISDIVVERNISQSAKPFSDPTPIDTNRLVDRNDDSHSSNARELNEFVGDDDFQFDKKPSAKSSNENFSVVTDMFDDGSGHHASTNHITSTSNTNSNNFDGKIIADEIPIEGNDAILNDAPSIIFYDSPTGDATRNDDDHPNDKFSDSSSDASAAIPHIVKLANEKEHVITDKSVRDKYKYNVIVSDTPNEIDGNEIPETAPNDDENEQSNHIFVETAPSNQPPDFRMLDDTNRPPNDSSIEKQTQRILVNVSIATDSGAGSQNHGVYMLHVSVPVGPEFMSNIDFQNASHVHHPHTVNVTPSFKKNDDFFAADSSSSPCPCDCNAALRNQWNATERESMANESTAQNDGTSTAPPSPPLAPPPPPIEENRFCLNEQDIPPILILEGEPYR